MGQYSIHEMNCAKNAHDCQQRGQTVIYDGKTFDIDLVDVLYNNAPFDPKKLKFDGIAEPEVVNVSEYKAKILERDEDAIQRSRVELISCYNFKIRKAIEKGQSFTVIPLKDGYENLYTSVPCNDNDLKIFIPNLATELAIKEFTDRGYKIHLQELRREVFKPNFKWWNRKYLLSEKFKPELTDGAIRYINDHVVVEELKKSKKPLVLYIYNAVLSWDDFAGAPTVKDKAKVDPKFDPNYNPSNTEVNNKKKEKK